MACEAVLYGVKHLLLACWAVNHSFHIQTYQYSLKTLHLGKSFWDKVPYLGVLEFFFLKKNKKFDFKHIF